MEVTMKDDEGLVPLTMSKQQAINRSVRFKPYGGTVTGRFSGTKPNESNCPKQKCPDMFYVDLSEIDRRIFNALLQKQIYQLNTDQSTGRFKRIFKRLKNFCVSRQTITLIITTSIVILIIQLTY
jgi:hypothetical protein